MCEPNHQPQLDLQQIQSNKKNTKKHCISTHLIIDSISLHLDSIELEDPGIKSDIDIRKWGPQKSNE